MYQLCGACRANPVTGCAPHVGITSSPGIQSAVSAGQRSQKEGAEEEEDVEEALA